MPQPSASRVVGTTLPRYNPTMRNAVLLLACACGSTAAPPTSGPVAPVTEAIPAPPERMWPALDGWQTETIAFPLGFAPEIELRGEELLRFAPNFYDATKGSYFTYAFVWLVDAPTATIDAPWLSLQVERYFDGLCRAVADSPDVSCAAHPTKARVTAASASTFGFAASERWRLELALFDGFKAERPVALEGTIERGVCGDRVVIATAVAPPGSAFREALRAQAQAFRCP
jgi:hypothetical protein